jgi:CubicO group peptidase (beta-lactamase class C family)
VRAHTNAHVLDILSRQRALNYTPGAQYSYTNSGYNLLAIIVERVSGKPLAQFTKERIFEPLGMSSTQWRDDFTRIVKGRATAYAARQGGYAIDMPFENAHGNGGLLTTVRDLLVWDHAVETGKIGGPRFRETMQQRGRLNDGSEISYAAGLMVGTYNAVPEVSHTGATGGYRAFLGRYPAQRISVAMLCNAGDADRGSAGRRIADAFLGTTAPPPAQPSPPQAGSGRQAYTPDHASLLAYAGDYYSQDAEVALVVEVDNGKLIARRRPDTRITLTPVEQDVFQAGPFGRIGFLRDGAGRVTQLSVRQARVFDLRFDRTNQP